MVKRPVALSAVCLFVATISAANAGGADKITGGGQVLVGTRGAGDTIAFEAQNTGTDDAARGQIQYVDRDGGTGQGQSIFHGEITCLVVSGNMAKAAGTFSGGGPFQLIVVDNGEDGNADNDVVALQEDQDPTCEDDDDDDDADTALARGNAQVHDN
jgi:hypothetical protein